MAIHFTESLSRSYTTPKELKNISLDAEVTPREINQVLCDYQALNHTVKFCFLNTCSLFCSNSLVHRLEQRGLATQTALNQTNRPGKKCHSKLTHQSENLKEQCLPAGKD